MSNSRQKATDETGQLIRREGIVINNYEDFLKELKNYTDLENDIINTIPTLVKDSARNSFHDLVNNFRAKKDFILKRIDEVGQNIRKHEKKIESLKSIPKEKCNFDTFYTMKLSKLEVSKLETFMWLLHKEIKTEELRKIEALRQFMAHCGNNELAPETSDM